MLVLAKAVMAIMLGFSLSVVFGYFVVKWFRKKNINQQVSATLGKRHQVKNGTPTSGGIIFILPTVLIMVALVITGKIEFSTNLFIVMFVFIAYAILGYMDDRLKRKNNDGMSIFLKLFFQIVIALVFFYIFMSSGNDPIVDIHTLGIKINLGWLYGMFLLLVLVASSNAVNITDGLDGLAGGLSSIAFFAF